MREAEKLRTEVKTSFFEKFLSNCVRKYFQVLFSKGKLSVKRPFEFFLLSTLKNSFCHKKRVYFLKVISNQLLNLKDS